MLLRGQERNLRWYDQQTYQLYEQQDWPALIELGKEALRQDHDFFYLRMRLAWAFYQQNRHRLAVRQYYKALKFSSLDPVALEMLYYNLLYSGQQREAWLIRSRWPDENPAAFLQFRSVQFEAGMRNSRQNHPVGRMEFGNAGFSHQLGPHLLLQHQYQFLRQHYIDEELVEIPSQGQGPSRTYIHRSETTVDQQEYRLGASYQLRRGWSVHGAFHPLWYTDTLGNHAEQAVAFAISKEWPLLSLTGGIGFADLGGQYFQEYQVEMTLYPLGNTFLYYRAAGMVKDGYETASLENTYWLSQHLGFRLFENTWLEGQYGFGKAANFYEGMASLVYNLPDPIEQRYGAGLQYWLDGRHLFYLYYFQEHKIFAVESSPYRQYTILGGIRFSLGPY